MIADYVLDKFDEKEKRQQGEAAMQGMMNAVG